VEARPDAQLRLDAVFSSHQPDDLFQLDSFSTTMVMS
jgi:hypothetical protein